MSFYWILCVALILFAGMTILFAVVRTKRRKQESEFVGSIKVETSDPDGPYLFLELNIPVGELLTRDAATLKIEHSNLNTRK